MATLLAQAGRIYVFISIHTTLAGGDMEAKILGKQKMNISIHTTLAGGDLWSFHQPYVVDISIHTTLAGGDSKNGREIHPFSIPIKA